MMDYLSVLVGMLIATMIGDRLGPSILLNWSDILYMLAGLVVLVMLRQAWFLSTILKQVEPDWAFRLSFLHDALSTDG